jgi:hypothetical protein
MRLSDTLSATFEQCSPHILATARDRIDPAWIDLALRNAGMLSVRRRKLPAEVVVWLIIGANLIAGMAFDEVVRHLGLTPPTRRASAQTPPTSSAVSDARGRLGDVAMRELFAITSRHWRDLDDFTHLRFHGLQVLAADGFALRTADTSSNAAEFGKPSSRRGDAAYPVVNAVAVIEVATHLVVDVELGSAKTSELAMFERLAGRLPRSSVTVLDRNYDSVRHLRLVQQGGEERHYLARSKGRVQARVLEEFSEGDERVEIIVNRSARRKDPTLGETFIARRVRYTAGSTQITLLTSMLDPVRFPALEIARLYHQRWEIEMAIDDLKTEQRNAAVTLRSKSPVGIRQEIYGLLVAHNLVRIEMARVAVLLDISPTRISFHRALGLVCEHLRRTTAGSPPSKWVDREALLLNELRWLVLPERRSHRHFPRAMKMPVGRYPRKLPVARA